MDNIGPISEVRAHLPEVVSNLGKKGKRFIITRQGKAVAIMISPTELETLEIMADLGREILESERQIKRGDTVLWSEIKRKHGL